MVGKMAPIIGGIPESVQYHELKVLERKLDSVITAKQVRIFMCMLSCCPTAVASVTDSPTRHMQLKFQDSLSRPEKLKKYIVLVQTFNFAVLSVVAFCRKLRVFISNSVDPAPPASAEIDPVWYGLSSCIADETSLFILLIQGTPPRRPIDGR